MPEFEVRQSRNLKLTSNSGLALIGLCCEAAQVDLVIDPRLPVSQGMKTSDLVKSLVGLLSLGKSDLEAIEVYRADRFFKESEPLESAKQRVDAAAARRQGRCAS